MNAASQMQQFMAMQQQMMTMMTMQAGAKDEASAALMADQLAKMQALCATMTASMNITQKSPEKVSQPKVETPIISEPEAEENEVKITESVQIEQLEDAPEISIQDEEENVQ